MGHFRNAIIPPPIYNDGLPDRSRESYPKNQPPLDSDGLILKDSSAFEIIIGCILLLPLRSKPYRVADALPTNPPSQPPTIASNMNLILAMISFPIHQDSD